jgi:hypothetical protein
MSRSFSRSTVKVNCLKNHKKVVILAIKTIKTLPNGTRLALYFMYETHTTTLTILYLKVILKVNGQGQIPSKLVNLSSEIINSFT